MTRTSDGWRLLLERAARFAAILALLGLIGQAIAGTSPGVTEGANARALGPALTRWTEELELTSARLRVDGPVSPTQRAWLAAIAGAGSRVTWNGPNVIPVSAVARRERDPRGGTELLVAAPTGAMVHVADASGVIDSVEANGAGARFLVYSGSRVFTTRAGDLAARSVATDSLLFRPVLVLGHAGWETQFVASALEERGWSVDSRLVVSPHRSIGEGTILPIDTARFSAVIVVDSSIRDLASEIVRYVQSGGGLVMSAEVLAATEFEALSTGSLGQVVPAIQPFDSVGPNLQRSLELTPILLASDAVALESRRDLVAVAVRRVARGRVATIGYSDTWRWRMAGGSRGEREHRAWWAALVASVARVGGVERPPSVTADEAPFASLIERLGPPWEAPGFPPLRPHMPWLRALLFGLFVLALLIDWGSRRLRGAA
jgi:hypothetical protein